ncbi:MAG TPA: TIGR03618 family F420-dependent PPOX class oxidoreductase [Candidatus Limnocylindrales bacterium]|nr:TIGR03618 family F420-dependent PPOX class oxidoreductase [Candidatus Limnocylindrales bacterium]
MGDSLTVPDDLLDLVTTDRIGHVSFIRPDGSIVTHLMWIDWDGSRIVTSSPVGSVKGDHARRDPHVSVSVSDPEDPWRFVIVRGYVTDIQPDEDLAFIDKMSLRYSGTPYRWRTNEREVFYITPEHLRTGRGGWHRRKT